MFSRKMNVGEGQKYDVHNVSNEGITAEELAKIKKKDLKMLDIYKAFGASEQYGLSQLDLADAMDAFEMADADQDGKLSKKELEQMAKDFNEEHGLTGDKAVDRKDLRDFLKSIRKFTKKDEKTSVIDVYKNELNKQLAEAEKLVNDAEYHKNMNKIVGDAYNDAMAAVEQQKADEVAKKAEEARIKDLQTPKDYTVQNGERLDDLLKRSLEAQGIEVNDENMAKAKEEFVKNNPKALHGLKGKEYL